MHDYLVPSTYNDNDGNCLRKQALVVRVGEGAVVIVVAAAAAAVN